MLFEDYLGCFKRLLRGVACSLSTLPLRRRWHHPIVIVEFNVPLNTYTVSSGTLNSTYTIQVSYRIFMSNRKRGTTRKQRTE